MLNEKEEFYILRQRNAHSEQEDKLALLCAVLDHGVFMLHNIS